MSLLLLLLFPHPKISASPFLGFDFFDNLDLSFSVRGGDALLDKKEEIADDLVIRVVLVVGLKSSMWIENLSLFLFVKRLDGIFFSEFRIPPPVRKLDGGTEVDCGCGWR